MHSFKRPQLADIRFLKLLLVSPRNTVTDHISLFNATGCRALLTPPAPHSPIVEGILKARSLQVLDSPSLDDLLANTYPHYPFRKSFAEARNEPLVVVHTSGTTGVPKPIVYSHDFAASYIQWGQMEPPPGFETQVSLCQSNRFFITLPFFHVSFHTIVYPIISNPRPLISVRTGRLMRDRLETYMLLCWMQSPIKPS